MLRVLTLAVLAMMAMQCVSALSFTAPPGGGSNAPPTPNSAAPVPSHDGMRKKFMEFLDAVSGFKWDVAASYLADTGVFPIALPENECKSFNKTAYISWLTAQLTGAKAVRMFPGHYLEHGQNFAASGYDMGIINSTAYWNLDAWFKGEMNEHGQFTQLSYMVGNPKATKQETLFNDVMLAICNGTQAEFLSYFTANATFEYCESNSVSGCFTQPVAQWAQPFFASRLFCQYEVTKWGATCGVNVGLTKSWVITGTQGHDTSSDVSFGYHEFAVVGGGPTGKPVASKWTFFNDRN